MINPLSFLLLALFHPTHYDLTTLWSNMQLTTHATIRTWVQTECAKLCALRALAPRRFTHNSYAPYQLLIRALRAYALYYYYYYYYYY